MAQYVRQGFCNWCGQCCNSNYLFGGDPPDGSPWPKHYLRNRLAWDDESFNLYVQLTQFIERNKLNLQSDHVKYRGKNYYWIFNDDGVLCTDEPPYGDSSVCSTKCPFLILHGEIETPPTECAVEGTKVWNERCGILPPDRFNDQQVAEWQASHPACSYTWELE